MRFKNNGTYLSEEVSVKFDQAFKNSLSDQFKRILIKEENNECRIGPGDYYDILLQKLMKKIILIHLKVSFCTKIKMRYIKQIFI